MRTSRLEMRACIWCLYMMCSSNIAATNHRMKFAHLLKSSKNDMQPYANLVPWYVDCGYVPCYLDKNWQTNRCVSSKHSRIHISCVTTVMCVAARNKWIHTQNYDAPSMIYKKYCRYGFYVCNMQPCSYFRGTLLLRDAYTHTIKVPLKSSMWNMLNDMWISRVHGITWCSRPLLHSTLYIHTSPSESMPLSQNQMQYKPNIILAQPIIFSNSLTGNDVTEP